MFLNYSKTFFLHSISNLSDIKIIYGTEIAFTGYSNSGKSSAINVLTSQKKLARSSKIPGRTQLINFFEVVFDFRIVDLPGYGYSKMSESIKLKCEKMIFNYFETRKPLKLLVLCMDIRYPLKHFDFNVIDISIKYNLPILLLLTKCDKLSTSNQILQLRIVKKKIKKFFNIVDVILFSSLKKIGIKKLQSILNYWYDQYRNKVS